MKRICLLLLAACAAPREWQAERWPEADALFRQEPRWLGADAALSIPLGDERVLWLFGDSFVATAEPRTRRHSVMVRNSIGVQHGVDPLRARMTMHWQTDANGKPLAFFAPDGEIFFWPGHGQRLSASGPLVLFLIQVRNTPGLGLGFRAQGWRIARIAAPDLPPQQWRIEHVTAEPTAFPVCVGTAVVDDGDHVIALAIDEPGSHAGYLARFAKRALATADTVAPQWWQDGHWVAQRQLVGRPSVVLQDAGPECSLHWDRQRGRWLHVMSRGFGATTLAISEAERLTGPWSAPRDVFTPPESRGERPFVYAGKAHPELGGDALVITYATNSFEFRDLFTPTGMEQVYWPRFVRARLAGR